MDKLEIKQGSFIQQTQYFIPVEIDLSVVPARLGISDFFTCPVTTVIQDLLVRRQFSLVSDKRLCLFFKFLLIYSKPCLVQLPRPYSFQKIS